MKDIYLFSKKKLLTFFSLFSLVVILSCWGAMDLAEYMVNKDLVEKVELKTDSCLDADFLGFVTIEKIPGVKNLQLHCAEESDSYFSYDLAKSKTDNDFIYLDYGNIGFEFYRRGEWFYGMSFKDHKDINKGFDCWVNLDRNISRFEIRDFELIADWDILSETPVGYLKEFKWDGGNVSFKDGPIR